MDEVTRHHGSQNPEGPRSLEGEQTDEVPPVLPRVGDLVGGKYRIEKVVGRGGMGIVYAAHHLALDKRIALKLLLVDGLQGGETVERFLREAQASARLRSDHVVRVTDAGALDTGHPYLAMEYLEGCDLAELLSLEGPQPCSETADYMLQALAALAEAHAAGIVHRDLKPANLFLAVRDDKTNILKILDFGISKQSGDRAHWKDLTGQTVLGTPVYMSPEQLRSSKNVDPRADLWSLGVVMYELLTGKVPFDGDGPGEVFAAVLEHTPASPRVHRPDLSATWEDIILRCLRRDPEARFQNAGELAEALAPLGSGQWAHLLPGIRQALAQPAVSLPKSGKVLLAAAVAAARASMVPPPEQPTGDAQGPSANLALPPPPYTGPLAGTVPITATLAADRGQFASVAPIAATPFVRRALWQPKVIAAAVCLAGVTTLASVRTLRAPAGKRPSVTVVSTAETTRPPPLPLAPPATSAGDPWAPGDAPGPSSSPPSPAPSSSAAPGTPPPSPARPVPGHGPGPVPAKRSPADARPKFLKSWN